MRFYDHIINYRSWLSAVFYYAVASLPLDSGRSLGKMRSISDIPVRVLLHMGVVKHRSALKSHCCRNDASNDDTGFYTEV